MLDIDSKDSQSKLESLRGDLYNPLHTPKQEARKELSSYEPQIRHTWREKQTESDPREDLIHTHSKLFRNIFLGAIIFCVGAFAFMMISLIQGRSSVSNDNILLVTDVPPFVDGGENITYTITITNENTVPLELADLVLEYQSTAPLTTETTGRTERHRIPIGTLLPRQEITEEYPLTLYGQEGEERVISATLEYRIPGSNSIFTKSVDTKVALQSSPIRLVLNAPDTAVSGQPVELTMTIASNGEFALGQNAVRVEYPRGFVFQSASFDPIEGTTTMWDIGDLASGSEYTLSIRGYLEGELGAEATIHAYVGSFEEEQSTSLGSVYATASHTITLSSPFLTTTLGINGSFEDEVVVKEGEPLRVSIQLRNTTSNRLGDVRATLRLDNDLLRTNTLQVPGGRYDVHTKTITWAQDTFVDLTQIDPGSSASVGFSVALSPLVDSSTGTVIKSPRIPLSVSVRATGSDGTIYQAESIDNITALITTSVVVESETLHASGPFPNSGPLPPSVGKPTTYTLHWRIRNVANALSDTRITSKLAPGVTWLGQISPSTEQITYNTESKTFVWNVGTVPPGTGYGTVPKDVYFQVVYTPSPADVGQVPRLTQEVVLTANDTFTDQTTTARRREHTTELVGDTIESNGRVTQ